MEERDGSRVRVKITSHAACSNCHAKGACSVSGDKEKQLTISSVNNAFKPGDRVRVILARSLGFKALFLVYLLPFILVMAVLLLMSYFSGNELASGLASLGVLPPYYIILRLRKSRIDRQFEFIITGV